MTEKLDLIYSATHEKCGREIRQRDPGVETQADLDALLRKTLWEGKLTVIELHCANCIEEFHPTHVEILVDGELVMKKRELEKFMPVEWKMSLN